MKRGRARIGILASGGREVVLVHDGDDASIENNRVLLTIDFHHGAKAASVSSACHNCVVAALRLPRSGGRIGDSFVCVASSASASENPPAMKRGRACRMLEDE